MKEKLPNIFEYNDFCKYLADYQKARQKFDRSFSKSEFSRMLKLPNTRSYLNDVFNGKKVTTTFVERFIDVLQLDKEEAQYFRVLVKFNQAENPDERELYFDQLISLNRSPKQIIDKRMHHYYRNWYNGALRAVLNICDFDGTNYNELIKKIFPPITLKQAKNAIALLEELNLVEKNESGYYKPTSRSITTSDYVRDELIKEYQLQCLALAREAIIKNKSQKQAISTNMISISGNGLKRIEKKLAKVRSEIRSMVQKDEEPADRIYQLDILLFPNSK